MYLLGSLFASLVALLGATADDNDAGVCSELSTDHGSFVSVGEDYDDERGVIALLLDNVFQTTQASPFLFASKDDFQNINLLADSDDTFAEARDAILADANRARLALSQSSAETFRAGDTFPVAGYNYSSLAGALRDLGLAWALTGDERYARPGVHAFLAYARGYEPAWSSSLSESGWLIQLAWAFDLLNDSMTPQESKEIRALLLSSARSTLRQARAGMNWQTRINAAVGLTGIVLQEKELLRTAILGEEAARAHRKDKPDLMGSLSLGFLDHITHSLRKDGMWFEQSMSYHYLSLQYLSLLAEAAHRQGIPLWDWSHQGVSLREGLLAPLYHAYRNGTMAPFGDSDPEILIPTWVSWYYGLAATRYQDSQLLRLWQQSQPRLSRDARYPRLFVLYAQHQASLEAINVTPLFIGTEFFAPDGHHSFGNTLLSGVGMAVLRGGLDENDPQLESAMIYKPYGTLANHQQADNLSIEIISQNHRWVPNIGKLGGYNDPLHQGWAIHTASSNTIIVDQTSQYPQGHIDNQRHTRDRAERKSSGTLNAFAASPVFAYVSASTTEVYPGVTLKRSLLNAGSYVVDYSTARSDEIHTYDWITRLNGNLLFTSLPLSSVQAPNLGTRSGYQYLRFPQPIECGETETWDSIWENDGQHLALTLYPANESELFLTQAPFNKHNDIPTVLIRQHSKVAHFLAVYSLPWNVDNGDFPQIVELSSTPDSPFVLRMSVPGKDRESITLDTFVISHSPTPVALPDFSFQGNAIAFRKKQDQLTDLLLVSVTCFESDTFRLLPTPLPINLSWHVLSPTSYLLTLGLSSDGKSKPMPITIGIPQPIHKPVVYQIDPLSMQPSRIGHITNNVDLTLVASPLTHYIICEEDAAIPDLPSLQLTIQSR